MSFSLIATSPISSIQQYQDHLSKLIYLKNLKRLTNDSTNYQLLEIRNILDHNLDLNKGHHDENVRATEQLSLTLNGSIQDGFNQLSDNLNDGFSELGDILSDLGSNLEAIQDDIQIVGRCLVDLASLLDWKTDLIIKCQQTTNNYLKKLIDLSRLSDDAKKRIELLDKSGMHLTHAIKEGPDSKSFSISLDYLIQLDKIDPHDFICHFRKGITHSKSVANLDIDEAIR